MKATRRMVQLKATAVTVLVLVVGSTMAALAQDASYQVRSIEFKQAYSPAELDYLGYLLETDGLVAMRNVPQFAETRRSCFELIAKCYEAGVLTQDKIMSIELADGTKRTTLAAKATVETNDFGCRGLDAKLKTLRALVDNAAQLFARALDAAVLDQQDKPLLMAVNNPNRESYDDFGSVIELGDHLDHFHVYEKRASESDDAEALEKHTDQGLFVAIVPSMTFKHGVHTQVDDGFEVELRQGMTKITIPNNGDSILFMLGDGIKNWLNARSVRQLRPVPHRLFMPRSDVFRVWFGRMFFPPKDAYMHKHKVSFEKVRVASMASSARSLSFGGCSNRFHILTDVAGSCAHSEEIYCWMACRSTAGLTCGSGETIQCVQGSTGNVWTNEDQHCTDCAPACKAPSTGSPNQVPNTNGGLCNVNLYPTNMYMDGFNGVSNNIPCLVFLFQTWVMDTQVKYAFGAIGSFMIGVFIEFIIFVRRELKKPKFQRNHRMLFAKLPDNRSPKRYGFMLVFLYGLQLVFAYFAMLLAMSFAAVIFSMVMLGFVVGHVLFNFQTPAAGNEACCAANEEHVGNVKEADSVSSSDQNKSPNCCVDGAAASPVVGIMKEDDHVASNV